MSDSTFTVEVGETGSAEATSALVALREALGSASAAFDGLKASLDSLRGSTAAGAEGIAGLKDQLASTKDAVAPLDDVKDAAEGAGAGAKSGTVSARTFFTALGAGAGPMGGFIGKAKMMARAIGSGGFVAGAVIAVAAIVAITVAIAAAIVKTAEWAVGLADTARSAALMQAGVEASAPALKGITSALEGVHSRTGVALADLDAMAEGFVKTGLKGKALDDAVNALATAKAGGATSDYLAKLKADLDAGGAAAAKAAANVQKAFGGIVAQKMLSLDAQSAKLHENIAGIFGGLKIDGLLEGFSKLVALFDKNTSSGHALKAMFEIIFQPLIDGATNAIPKVVQGFKQLEIAGLKAYIALKKWEKSPAGKTLIEIADAIVAIYGPIDALIADGLDLNAMFATVVDTIALGLPVVEAMEGAFAIWDAIGDVVSDAWGSIKDAVNDGINFLTSIDLSSIGSDLIDGLVNGIEAAGGAVLSALTGIVGGAITGVKSMLGIASPSKVFAKLGVHTSAGLAQGIDSGADDVQASASGLASSAVKGASGGSSSRASKSGGGNVYNIVINGVKDAEQMRSPSFLDQLAEAIELQVAMGGGVPA